MGPKSTILVPRWRWRHGCTFTSDVLSEKCLTPHYPSNGERHGSAWFLMSTPSEFRVRSSQVTLMITSLPQTTSAEARLIKCSSSSSLLFSANYHHYSRQTGVIPLQASLRPRPFPSLRIPLCLTAVHVPIKSPLICQCSQQQREGRCRPCLKLRRYWRWRMHVLPMLDTLR